jgi:hypothetical protein
MGPRIDQANEKVSLLALKIAFRKN